MSCCSSCPVRQRARYLTCPDTGHGIPLLSTGQISQSVFQLVPSSGDIKLFATNYVPTCGDSNNQDSKITCLREQRSYNFRYQQLLRLWLPLGKQLNKPEARSQLWLVQWRSSRTPTALAPAKPSVFAFLRPFSGYWKRRSQKVSRCLSSFGSVVSPSHCSDWKTARSDGPKCLKPLFPVPDTPRQKKRPMGFAAPPASSTQSVSQLCQPSARKSTLSPPAGTMGLGVQRSTNRPLKSRFLTAKSANVGRTRLMTCFHPNTSQSVLIIPSHYR